MRTTVCLDSCLCLLESPRFCLLRLSTAQLCTCGLLQATFARISGYVEQVLMLFWLASSAQLSRAGRLLPRHAMSHGPQDHKRGLRMQQEPPCACRMTFTPLAPLYMRLWSSQLRCASLM